VERLKARGIVPSLTVILVGDDPGSQVYVRNKERACLEAGMAGRVIPHAEGDRAGGTARRD
jgi:methylenetetrahydrofolate dehydrogenase (NADP+)/methenyltetrahydrofolate cyclohydrolase